MQQRVTIDPRDIVAIEYQCRQCASRFSVAIDHANKSQMNCPNCSADWIRGEYTAGNPNRVDTTIAEFSYALRKLLGITSEATIRLEIAVPIKSQEHALPSNQ